MIEEETTSKSRQTYMLKEKEKKKKDYSLS